MCLVTPNLLLFIAFELALYVGTGTYFKPVRMRSHINQSGRKSWATTTNRRERKMIWCMWFVYCLGKIDGWLSVRCTRINRQKIYSEMWPWRAICSNNIAIAPVGQWPIGHFGKWFMCVFVFGVGCMIHRVQNKKNTYMKRIPWDLNASDVYDQCSWA